MLRALLSKVWKTLSDLVGPEHSSRVPVSNPLYIKLISISIDKYTYLVLIKVPILKCVVYHLKSRWRITTCGLLKLFHVHCVRSVLNQMETERSHMTSAAEGGCKCWQGGGGGGGVSKPCWRQHKYLNFGKNCFLSSVPITMRETTALIYSPKLMAGWRLSLLYDYDCT